MKTVRVETTVERDGEVHFSNLPCRRGERVGAILLLGDDSSESSREAARQQFLERAKASTFCSSGPYPSRDELHERRIEAPTGRNNLLQ
jgi:hypothetical protein